MYFILLLVLPLLISAKITINVDVYTNKSEVKINHTGIDYKIVTNSELNIFNITTEKLKAGVKVELGREPNEVFLKDPTQYGDLFNKFNWDPVKRSLKVNKVKVVDVINENVILQTHVFINNTSTPIKSARCMSGTVENTAQSSWFVGGIPSGNIFYELNFNLGYGKMKYRNKWRNDSLHVSKMSTGMKKTETVNLKPSQIIVTNLLATKTILLIEIEYIAKLVGSLVANYEDLYGKYHFWAPSIQDIMRQGNMTNKIYTREQIEVRCYLDPKLEVRDRLTGKIIKLSKKKRPLVRILRNKKMKRILYTRFKKPEKEKKVNKKS